MKLDDFILDIWFPYVFGIGMTFADWVMNYVSDKLGDFAGLMALIVSMPLVIVLLFVGALATAVGIALLLLASPLVLPITVYRHIRG